MKLGIPKEILTNETRVAAIPLTIKQYINAGFEVLIETGAGTKSLISDNDYINAGAKIVDSSTDLFLNSDMILKVKNYTGSKDGCIKLSNKYLRLQGCY